MAWTTLVTERFWRTTRSAGRAALVMAGGGRDADVSLTNENAVAGAGIHLMQFGRQNIFPGHQDAGHIHRERFIHRAFSSRADGAAGVLNKAQRECRAGVVGNRHAIQINHARIIPPGVQHQEYSGGRP